MNTLNKKTKTLTAKYLLILMLVFSMPAFADDELPGFDDDVTDNDAPINDYIPFAMVAGAVLGYKVLRQKKQIV